MDERVHQCFALRVFPKSGHVKAKDSLHQRLDLVLSAAGRSGFHRFAVRANADLRRLSQQSDLGGGLLFA